jgi:glucose-1-phosphate adenylyltransferase
MNLQRHKDTDADVTVACVPMDYSHAAEYPLMKINNEGQVIQFNEKPRRESLTSMQVDATVLGLSPNEARRKPFIASMGIYVFKKRVLLKLLRWRYPSANDFAAEIIPASVNEFNVQAYLFRDYWEDIGTIKSFFDANLALTVQVFLLAFSTQSKHLVWIGLLLFGTLKIDAFGV